VTRREQYHQRRQRYQRRANRMYRTGFIYTRVDPAPGHPHYEVHRIGRKTPLWNSGGKQQPLQLKHPPKHLFQEIGVVFGNNAEIVPAKHRKPPIARWIGLAAAEVLANLPSHQRRSAINYQGRRLKRVPHKPDRMKGYQRIAWAAGLHAMQEGYFPDWDSLHRHPNYADFLGGWVYPGPFPPVPD